VINARLFVTVRDQLNLTYDVSFELNQFDRLNAAWFCVSVTATPAKIAEATQASLQARRGGCGRPRAESVCAVQICAADARTAALRWQAQRHALQLHVCTRARSHASCAQVLRDLKTQRIALGELERSKSTLLTRHESDLKDNSYMLNLITHLQVRARRR